MYEYKLTISFQKRHKFRSISTMLPWLRFSMRMAKNLKIHDATVRDTTTKEVIEFEDNKHEEGQNAV